MNNDLKNFLDGKIKEIEDNTSFIRGLPYDDEKLDLIMKTCIEISNFVLDLVKKEVEISMLEHNETRHGDTPDDAYARISTIINNLRV
jgi:hypothetical protein